MFEFLCIVLLILVVYGLYRLYKFMIGYESSLREDDDEEAYEEFAERCLKEREYQRDKAERLRRREPWM